MSAKGFHSHDHGSCVSDALAAAEAHCAETGARLTPVRRRVLEILLAEHRALGAYDVLEVLREEGLGSQPPVAYRALDFLVEHGLAHRVERMNAFIACSHPGETHMPAFLICRVCETVAETDAPTVRAGGFEVEQTVVEAEGVCPNCKDVA